MFELMINNISNPKDNRITESFKFRSSGKIDGIENITFD